MTQNFDIAVIGGGIGGLTAAHHAAMAGASVVNLLGAEAFGGLVLNVGALEGYPAGPAPVSGIDLASGLMEAAAGLGVEQRMKDAVAIAADGGGFRITTGDGDITARRVIAAMGARLRSLDVPGAAALAGRGVSQCAWCDASLYRGKHAVVVGGGDAALEETLHLAQTAEAVTLLLRGTGFRARRAYADRVAATANVTVRRATEVIEVLGTDAVTAVRVRDRETGTSAEIACAGVFVFIGVEPNASLVGDLADLDAAGAVITDARLETRTPGLHAIGALRAGYGGRLVHAVSDGATAAIAATGDLGR